ncbi:MAG: thermonuclease family protein [Deltaproteobacteria bacterium]|nr:thermonuclease family protein [Deltaproteobacteria bacterium]
MTWGLWPASQAKAGDFYKGRVERVADGDTIQLLTSDYERVRVRLYGIDAPEKDQEGGDQSLLALKNLIDGQEVTVDVLDVDQYSRLVGLIYLGDLSVSLAMVEQGEAWVYDQYCKAKEVCQGFRAAQAKARSSNIGLWANPSAKPPWEHRGYKRNNPSKKK